VREYSQKF